MHRVCTVSAPCLHRVCTVSVWVQPGTTLFFHQTTSCILHPASKHFEPFHTSSSPEPPSPVSVPGIPGGPLQKKERGHHRVTDPNAAQWDGAFLQKSPNRKPALVTPGYSTGSGAACSQPRPLIPNR